jgi:proliferating cell nuclear antigen
MFKAQLGQAGLLKRILEAVKELVSDANLDCSSSGISLQAMDPSHVSLVSLLLRADGFRYYRCDRARSLGVNLTSVAKILRGADNDDTLTLSADDVGDTVVFAFESARHDKTSTFELRLMDVDAEYLSIPDQLCSSSFIVSSHWFQRICRDLVNLGDTVVISVREAAVVFSASGDLVAGSVKLLQTADTDAKSNEKVIIESHLPVSLTFALTYLNYFARAAVLSPVVRLQLSPGAPLIVQYDIEDLGRIRYYLAPRIDDSE